MADDAESDAYENVNDPVVIFSLRTTARSRHTKAANRLLKYIDDKMSIDKIMAQLHVVEEAYKEAVLLNERYKAKATLSEEQLGATEAWKGEVKDLYERCCAAVDEYPRPTDPDPDDTNEDNLTVEVAKRRRLTLEYELEQSKIERAREMEDLKRHSQREQEDLKKQIEFQRKLETSIQPKPFSSTMIQLPDPESEGLPRALWPKITLKPFNGDPRLWPDFMMSFNALVHETKMPDSYKLIALRENLTPELKRRVANLFTGTSTYQAAIEGLKARYGTIQVIMHAHIQQLSALPPFRSGDFKSLLNMASLVRDAVSSVEEDANPNQFAYSNVVSQLVKILPQELQREWGRYAHPLRPNVPTLGDFDKWIDGIVGAEEMIGNTSSAMSQATRVTFSSTIKSPAAFRSTVMATHVSKNFENHLNQSRKCQACQQDVGHGLEYCQTFQSMTPTVRAEVCARAANCFRCLGRGHIAQDCKKIMLCNITGCERRHHPLLHGAERVFPVRQVLLAFVSIIVRVQGNRFRTLALLDSGSEATLVKRNFADLVGLRGKPTNIELGTYRDSNTLSSEIVKFEIEYQGRPNNLVVEEGFIVPNIKLSSRKVDWPNVKQAWAHLTDLDLPPIDSSKVNVLIGMDITDAHIQLEIRMAEEEENSGPTAVRTPFGWAVTGRIPSTLVTGPTRKIECFTTQVISSDVALVDLVERFHSTESFGTYPRITEVMAALDEMALRILERSIKFVNSHFQVRLLWKSEAVSLPNNRPAAMRRFFSVERRLMSNPKMAENYTATIEKYVNLGYVRLVKTEELEGPSGRTWFLPHHGVSNPNKPEKFRIVFDGSSKCEGVSLNDVLLRGPILLASLVGVIIRSRESPYAVSADIEAMYHQVQVDPIDQPALRFLWRRPGSETPPRTYQWTRVPFGLTSSPASCLFVLQYTASTTSGHQDVERIVKENFYVDNYVDSFENEEEAITTAHRVINVLAQGGFRLNQWVSSSRSILESIPASERNFPKLNLDLDNLPIERSLGMVWDCQDDCFQFITKSFEDVLTKRQLLSAISKIFDPLGLLLPITTFVKVLFQTVWRIKQSTNLTSVKPKSLSWDEELPASVVKNWSTWNNEVISVQKLKIPRCLRNVNFSIKKSKFELHVFCDASEVAFGAVCYLRTECGEETDSNIVFAKSRVAPMKTLSIPRLELQAAVLGTRIAKMVRMELRLTVDRYFYWTDSEIVLRWLNSSHQRYSPFVANRVSEILESSTTEEWSFVPGSLNSADDCSRGILPSKLATSHRWFKGPEFLRMKQEKWPKKLVWLEIDEDDVELKKEKVINAVIVEPENQITKLFGSVNNLEELKLAVIKVEGLEKDNNVVSSLARKSALLSCIKTAQQFRFKSDIQRLIDKKPLLNSSRLLKLNPFMDEEGLLRVGGRIDLASAPFDSRHPIILDANHPFTTLIVKEKHADAGHGGTERTLSEVRSQFWILKGRRAIRSVIAKCQQCALSRAKPTYPMMANLPLPRLQAFQYPFTSVGLDFFGPYLVVIGRRQEKRYGCLFTCLSTRAVHLEMTYKMDADSFLMAFRRFTGLRGAPKNVYSDNGTNIAAGERELREGVQNLNSTKIANELAAKEIHWIFSPPSAPHFGGVWERLVQSSKRAIRVVLQNRAVSDEVLVTVFAEISSLLNSRPLTHVSTDPNDLNPITPNHFILLRGHPHIPPETEEECHGASRRRWKQAQFIVDQFWKRWMREYVPALTERKKWFRETRNVIVGDQVLIVDENTKRGEWPIGKVIQVFSNDGKPVRHVLVRTKNGELKRPVTKLCLLPTDQNPAT